MNWTMKQAIGLLAALLVLTCATVALVVHFDGHSTPGREVLLWGLTALSVAMGAVTQNFLDPATGAVSPTAFQNLSRSMNVVDLVTDGVATTFTITHNLAISAADITGGYPRIFIEPNSPTGIPATLLIQITRPVTTNAVVLTFAAVAATFRVCIWRTHTAIR